MPQFPHVYIPQSGLREELNPLNYVKELKMISTLEVLAIIIFNYQARKSD